MTEVSHFYFWCAPLVHHTHTDSPLTADLWLLNSCTVKGPSEDGLKNSIRKGRELGKPLVVAGCVPQGQKSHPDVRGLSVVGVSDMAAVCSRP